MKMKKMNKKGFTLVELLAVIVILAVIVLVAVNNILPRAEEAKVRAFKTDVNMFMNAAEGYYLDLQFKGESWPTNGVKLEELVTKGLIKKADIASYGGCITYDSSSKVFKINVANSQFKTSGVVTQAQIEAFTSLTAGGSPIVLRGDSSVASFNCPSS